MKIFISHSSNNADAALKVCELLEENGSSCFLAPRDIRLGKEYAEEIVNGIDGADAMVLLMSVDANNSPHVLREVERAVSRAIPILVYKLEEVELSKSMEYFLMSHQWANAKEGDYSELLEFAAEGAQSDTPDRGTKDNMQNLKEKEQSPEENMQNLKKERHENVPKRTLLKGNALIMLACCIILAGGLLFLVLRQTAVKIPQDGLSALGKDTDAVDTFAASVRIGDTITFGSYNGEPIEWRVLKISDDGKEAVLIAKDILTMKAFDAAEGGKYNWSDGTSYWSQESEADTDMQLQVKVRGNSDWSTSNIRTWLNSSDEVVSYKDQPPKASAMAELKNGYNNEAGFLYGFTEEEFSAIKETEHATNANALSSEDVIITKDLVYLLSMEELQWFEDAGMSTLAVPNQMAVEQDQSAWYQTDLEAFGIKEYCWWLREPVTDMASQCYLVGNGYLDYNLRQENAGLEGYGVRPALTVDLQADCVSRRKVLE